MKCDYCGCIFIPDKRGFCSSCGAQPIERSSMNNTIRRKIEFRDFMGVCQSCGADYFQSHVEGDLVYEDDKIWVVYIYPDEQGSCQKCGTKNAVAKIFKATSYERMERGE